ncbi:MAG: hypothetical protein ACFE96_10485 [Candidatus Hermodarchaeota archaeon]
MIKELSKQIRLVFLISSLLLISFLMKYLSEWTHEFLGHGVFGVLLGGELVDYYVSWIWPLDFGYAQVILPLGSGYGARAIVASGGIIACGSAALLTQIFMFFVFRKRGIEQAWLTIGFHFVFWYGFWAFMNSIGYLLVGGLLNFGDIGQIVYLTGLPNTLFITIGFILLIILYFFVSANSYYLFGPLTNLSKKWITFSIWIFVPVIYILFSLNPDINLPQNLFLLLLPIMFIPSILSLIISTFSKKSKKD